jgi:hypothetical protein
VVIQSKTLPARQRGEDYEGGKREAIFHTVLADRVPGVGVLDAGEALTKDINLIKLFFFHYTVKKVSDFPVPSLDVINQNLPDREKLNYSPPGRILLVISRL